MILALWSVYLLVVCRVPATTRRQPDDDPEVEALFQRFDRWCVYMKTCCIGVGISGVVAELLLRVKR